MTSGQVVHDLLRRHQIEFTLLDLGASASSYEPFQKAAASALLIEVDPDTRDFAGRDAQRKTMTVNRAITDSDTVDSVNLYLTKSPYCSSTLKPDMRRLRNFPYSDLFEVVGTSTVPATSLNRLSAEIHRPFDWIKLDTQGTEYRILRSMNETLFERLLCCDVEISFYAHYENADTFPQFHDFMVESGFAIADILTVQERARIRRDDALELAARGVPQNLMKRWPTSPELRYIRSVNHDEPIDDLDRYLRIWAIAYFTGNYAYCYFLSARLSETSDHSELGQQLQSISLKQLRRSRSRMAATRILSRFQRWWA